MKAADLDILIQDGEGAMLEYNEDISSSLAREMVAFANTAGSHILLGLNDNGMVKGIVDNNAIVNPFPAVEEVVPQAPRKYPASHGYTHCSLYRGSDAGATANCYRHERS